MEDAAEEKRRRESMGRRAERIMKGFGIGEGEDENEMKIDGGMFFFFFLPPLPLCIIGFFEVLMLTCGRCNGPTGRVSLARTGHGERGNGTLRDDGA